MANKQFIHPKDVFPDKTYSINGVRVNEYLVKDHNINNLTLPSKRNYKLKGVTIHNTLTLGKDDDAKWYCAATCNDNLGGVFVHYYVDYNGAWKILPDDSMNWSCSDGIGYAGGNAATIAIEVIMDGEDGVNNSKAMNNAICLVAYILQAYGLTANDLYTHSYWINTKIFGAKGTRDQLNTRTNPRKNCPVYIIPQWDGFKKGVDNQIVKLGGKSIYDEPLPNLPNVDPGKKVQYIYQATSHAARRSGMSKDAKIYGRVEKGGYYAVDTLYDKTGWIKYANEKCYSMLKDGIDLFKRVGDYSTKRTTCKLNVREKPSTSAGKITVLPATTIVYIWGDKPIRADGYDWVRIVIEGKVGYVAVQYLK